MLIPAQIEKRRLETQILEDHVSRIVNDKILTFCGEQGFAYVGRNKDLASLAEKIETGRFRAWSELDDLFACTIVMPTLADQDDVLSFLKSEFHEVACRLRAATSKDPEVFRFDSTRFIGTLKEGASNFKFEVQVRTAFEHAWSVTTHALAYKGDGVSWRHKRLASQLRAAIEQLDQLVLGFQVWTDMVTEQRWPEVQQKKKIGEFFSRHVADGKIPAELVPKSWTRFSENLWGLISHAGNNPRRVDEDLLSIVLQALDEEITGLGISGIPRSTSLYQFCLGVIATKTHVSKIDKYTALITPELASLYPKVNDLRVDNFDFEFDSVS